MSAVAESKRKGPVPTGCSFSVPASMLAGEAIPNAGWVRAASSGV